MDVAITAQSSARSRAYCLTSDSPRSLVPQSRFVQVLLQSSFDSVISDADGVFELWPILKWHFEFLRDAFLRFWNARLKNNLEDITDFGALMIVLEVEFHLLRSKVNERKKDCLHFLQDSL